MSQLETQLDDSLALVKRVRELEKLNATLAAEVDRMRPVVEATQRWRHGCERRKLSQAYQMIVAMAKTVDAYEAAKEQDAKVRS